MNKTEEPQTTAKSEDSDNGKNPDGFGITNGTVGSGTGYVIWKDFCPTSTSVREHYCDEDGKVWFTDIVCEGICKDGFCSELNAEKSCEDSDGRDYYHKGKVTGFSGNSNESNFEFEDVCLNDGMVKEYYCEEEKFRNDVFKCEFGCEDAKCLISKNLSNNNLTSTLPQSNGTNQQENCREKVCSVKSITCVGSDKLITEECKTYLKNNGKCMEILTSHIREEKNKCGINETNKNSTNETAAACPECGIINNTCATAGSRISREGGEYYCGIDNSLAVQKGTKSICQNNYECASNNCKSGVCSPICEGCINSDSSCIPFGTRIKTEYCSLNSSFENQKDEESNCDNNYECSTNVCADNKCVSSGLIKKFMEWFRGFFWN